jgi:hypothetical protein
MLFGTNSALQLSNANATMLAGILIAVVMLVFGWSGWGALAEFGLALVARAARGGRSGNASPRPLDSPLPSL